MSLIDRSMWRPPSPSNTRTSRILAATYVTSAGPSSRPIPRSTTRPGPISPTMRSSTRTRASVTRWTTARTLLPDLDERRGALVLAAQRDAVAKLTARIEACVQEVPRHDVAEGLQHRLLHARMFLFEVEDQALDPLTLK